MKNLLLSVAVALIGLVACKKENTKAAQQVSLCNCKYQYWSYDTITNDFEQDSSSAITPMNCLSDGQFTQIDSTHYKYVSCQ